MISADQQLFEWINGFVGTWGWLDNTMKVLVSDFFLPVLIGVAVWALWFTGRTRQERLLNQMGFVYASAGAGFANLFIRLTNAHVIRPRPFVTLDDVNILFYQPTDPSFPSNAAAFAFAMATGVWLVNKKLGLLLGAGALLFSFARVYAGMHFPLDVVGGALYGILTAYLFYRVLGLFRPVVNFAFRVLRLFLLA